MKETFYLHKREEQMQKLQNFTLQDFLDTLAEELKRENEDREYENLSEDNRYPILDIPFLISSLWEAFRAEPNTYSDFIECLNKSYDYQINIVKTDNDYYGICKVIVGFCISGKIYEGLENYQYEIDFLYDPRDWGYCECTPDMEDYREDKKCCGHGCDWWAPAFEIRKSFIIGKHSWNGDEHDYWEFEDNFYKEDKELAEKEEKKRKEREIQELKARIEADTKKLAELGAI